MLYRVYELATKIGVTNQQMINLLWEQGIDVHSHLSTVEKVEVDKLLRKLSSQTDTVNHKNRTVFKCIEIIGLFSKYDYTINFNEDINIFVAENGFGKTTVLNIIVALLESDKNKLIGLPFRELKVTIGSKVISIDKKTLRTKGKESQQEKRLLLELRKYLPMSSYTRIKHEYMNTGRLDLRDIESNLVYTNRFRREEIDELQEIMWLIRRSQRDRESKIDEDLEQIKTAVKEEILYFPTYRRIEDELATILKDEENKVINLRESNIKFGMEDVQNILDNFTQKLKDDAIDAYTKINAEILDDLLSKNLEHLIDDKLIINKEEVNIAIARIGESRIKHLEKLMNFIDNKSNVSNPIFLQYYLYKLINIYQNQKVIDEKIERYVQVCDKYLLGKNMIYDKVEVRIEIIDEETKETLKLQDLSSGEKQIISLFTKIYLEISKPIIFIIDEPELSLSLTWQQDLLEDIYNCGKIKLLIATTHSPFIFKNDYRQYVKDMNMFKKVINNE